MNNVASCGSAPTIVVIMVGRKRSRQARHIAASARSARRMASTASPSDTASLPV
ncbi:MAG TPA: hypothetical protein VMA53_16870 [Stellaceae bacterium]|nr:hypothetical protein [Stellaceae bacterium]